MHKLRGGCQKHIQPKATKKDQAMSTFTETIEIDAPVSRVWATLADIGSIAEWNPGLVGSKATNDTIGLGATRVCDIDGRQTLDEEVVLFEPEHAINFRITRSTLPFSSADIRFTLMAEGEKAIVSVSPDYELKYGFVGRLLNWAFVLRAYRKGMRGLLTGLKERTEAFNKL